MNEDTSSIFQHHAAQDVPRDQWGRYSLPDETGETVGWTRATTFAATLAEAHGLRIWEQRQVVLGMGRRPDLVTLASTIVGPEDKKALGEIVDSAHEAAGTQAKANRGTAVHSAIQRVEQAPDYLTAINQVPAELRADVVGYFSAVNAGRLEIIPNLVERVVIIPEYRVAGTPDNYVRCPDGKIRVLDKKTGNLDYADIEFAVQLALYANAKALRNYGTSTYEPLPEIATDYAIIAHVVPGTGHTELKRVNIALGWAWARTCAEVMDIRKTKNVITPYIPSAAPSQIVAAGAHPAQQAPATPPVPSLAERAEVAAQAVYNNTLSAAQAMDESNRAQAFGHDANDTSALFYSTPEEEDEDPSPAGAAAPATAPAASAPGASPAAAPAAGVSAPTTPVAGAAGSDVVTVIDDQEAAAQALVDGAKGKAKLQQAAKDFASAIAERTGTAVEFKLNQHQIKLARAMVEAAVQYGVPLPAFAPSSRSKGAEPQSEDEQRLTMQLDQIRRMPTVEGLVQYQAQLGERWTDEHQQAARVRTEQLNSAAEEQSAGLTPEQIIQGATSRQTLQIAWRKATNNGANEEAWTPDLNAMAEEKSKMLTR